MKYPEKLVPREFAPYALAIGTLCNAWAHLESSVRMLFLVASRMEADRLNFGIVHVVDVRSAIEAIKLALIDKALPEDAEAAALATLNYVNNVLRPKRNRYVHDTWSFDDNAGKMWRSNSTPKTLKKAQARQRMQWSPLSFGIEELPDMWNTVREVIDHTEQLYRLQGVLRGQKGALSRLRRARPRRRFLHPRAEMPDLPDTP